MWSSRAIGSHGPGPVNFIDVHPRLETGLPHGVSISTDLVAQWRESLTDGVYAVPGFLLLFSQTQNQAHHQTLDLIGHGPEDLLRLPDRIGHHPLDPIGARDLQRQSAHVHD
jgi:hypothetical protein